jgi:hypothetical protein
VFANPSELHQAVGVVLGPTEWIELSQERINLFAEATQDFQVWLPCTAAIGLLAFFAPHV